MTAPGRHKLLIVDTNRVLFDKNDKDGAQRTLNAQGYKNITRIHDEIRVFCTPRTTTALVQRPWGVLGDSQVNEDTKKSIFSVETKVKRSLSLDIVGKATQGMRGEAMTYNKGLLAAFVNSFFARGLHLTGYMTQSTATALKDLLTPDSINAFDLRTYNMLPVGHPTSLRARAQLNPSASHERVSEKTHDGFVHQKAMCYLSDAITTAEGELEEQSIR